MSTVTVHLRAVAAGTCAAGSAGRGTGAGLRAWRESRLADFMALWAW